MTILKKVLAVTSAIALLFSTSVNSGITVLAEKTMSEESTFSVNIPDNWTNTYSDWVKTSGDINVFFKISDHSRSKAAWGTFSDSDAKEWNADVNLSETDSDGDYIKFWVVKDNTIQDDLNEIHFYYDKTMPNAFSVIKEGDGSIPYTLSSQDNIIDSISGISNIYYSISQQFNTIAEIESNATLADCDFNTNGVHFTISCTSEMVGNTVYVYAVDCAGNIQTSSIVVDSYIDTSAPSLIVGGIDSNSWVNKDTRLKMWDIHTDSSGAKIYYAVSDEDLDEGWGSYTDAEEWYDNVAIPEGKKYIHFWATYESFERDVAEVTKFYKYDKTDATLVFNDVQRIFNESDYTWKLNISTKTLSDEYSGVYSVYLRFYDNKNKLVDQEEINSNYVTKDANGNITAFSVYLEDWLKNTKIAFFVMDNAGNGKEYYLDENNAINFDPKSPFIDVASLKILSNERKKLNYHVFGSKNQGNENNSVYANDDAYLYLEVEDNDLQAIEVTINEKAPIKFTKDDLVNGNFEWKIESKEENANNKYTILIKLSLLKEKMVVNEKNYISIIALDGDPTHKSNVATFHIDENNQYSVLYDPDDIKDCIISSSSSIEPLTENGNNYYGNNYKDNSVSFDISDDNGLNDYSVKVNGTIMASADLSNGTKITGTYETIGTDSEREIQTGTNIATETYSIPIDKTQYSIPFDNSTYDFSQDGRYEIFVSAKDLAGNIRDYTYSFIIDTVAPKITNCEYKYNKSLIKYLSFGLFGNESYEISVKATDITGNNKISGIGIKNVELYWGSETEPYIGRYNTETKMYEFASLPIGHRAIPFIVVTDKLGNKAKYCMVSADNIDDDNDHHVNIQLEELSLDDYEGNISLVLENTAPISSIIPSNNFEIPENDSDEIKIYKQLFEDGHEEWWYPNNFEYQITAQDDNSGLYSVVVTENEEQRSAESKYSDISFNEKSFVDKASYFYDISDEGNYKLFTYAIDNAQNTNQFTPQSAQSFIVHLDKTKPQITEFQFDGNSDRGETVERTTYGFFFMDDTEVRVYVDDPNVSSGLSDVVLYLNNVNGDTKTLTKAESAFETDHHNGRRYASFTIEKGFKGKVTSIVTDNVGHSSGLINANGNIVEDSILHSHVSSIKIEENKVSKQKDANGVKLYNTSIPVTVTITDTFSGIKAINWNIVNDKEKGKIEVDIDGNWKNTEGKAHIIEDTIKREQNLITQLQFIIVVDSNTNGNVVHISFTDRSGNSSEYETTYSIDTTAPIISATLGGGKVSNGHYYNTNQTVTVSINERNFDPSAVVVKVNNNIQKVEWNEQNSSVTSDKAVHKGTFVIATDGKYDFTIRYTDMAGNVGIPYSQPKFIIDKINPKSSIIPLNSFTIPENNSDKLKVYKQLFEDGHEEWWYPNNFEYQITAQDDNAGLYSVVITENGNKRAEESKYGDVSFEKESFVDKVLYSYTISDEGNYKLFTYAIDNATNTNQLTPQSNQSFIVHLDKTKPQITEFQFGGNLDRGETVERTTYGFFFMDDTEVRVYVDDLNFSSGLNDVVLYLNNVNGDKKILTKAESAFDTDNNGRRYASFMIEKGFKGKVTSIVTDNVGHSSGLINANGNIVEDSILHSQMSSIKIEENEVEKQKDANGVKLYNTSIPVTVTITDTFSGIKTIDWNITGDNEKGRIEVDIDGNWRNAEGKANIIEDTIERDQNLITKLQFLITVDSNTNGNVVHVLLTDRSGNSNEEEATYSIDTTAPIISATLDGGKVSNGYYYNTKQTVTVSINERNFDPSDVVFKVNNNIQEVEWNEKKSSVTSDKTEHKGIFVIDADGEYDFTIGYTDMAGNTGVTYSQPRFIIDKTKPKISNNFESFGKLDDPNIYYNSAQKEKAKAEISVVEANFLPEDMDIKVYYKPAGSKHSYPSDSSDPSEKTWESYSYSPDWKDDGKEKHTLVIPFKKDGVYKILMAPKDRAGNDGNFSKGEGSSDKYPSETAVFETDYTAPVIVSRNSKSVTSDDVEFYDLYGFERREDAKPNVIFEDKNMDYIGYTECKYTPVYSDGKEIGEIKPEVIKDTSRELVEANDETKMIYILKNFTKDGIYSVKLTAYDKAGNESTLNDNTYVRMVDPTVSVLAYIENSNRENLEGWYSFEDENGPISKQPSSFSDLSIVVFSKTDDTRIYLVDKATNSFTDTNITDNREAIFDNSMYKVRAYRYTLPGEYFEKNYTADVDTNLYLRVKNNGKTFDLGEMYIDNTDPNCNLPEHFCDWGWFKGSGNQTLIFDSISEVLDINETVAYVDGQTVHLSNMSGNEFSSFVYNEGDQSLALTLEPGSHRVGLLLVDKAGNAKSITEVQHLAIGNYRIWIGVGTILGAILLTVIVVFIIKKIKRRRF